jgi:hypothetical protein
MALNKFQLKVIADAKVLRKKLTQWEQNQLAAMEAILEIKEGFGEDWTPSKEENSILNKLGNAVVRLGTKTQNFIPTNVGSMGSKDYKGEAYADALKELDPFEDLGYGRTGGRK